jgi:hypothetical protein
MTKLPTNPSEPDDVPPFTRTWGRLYALVIGFLVVMIIALTWLSRAFS